MGLAGHLNVILFSLYLVLNIALGITVARRGNRGARDYFLAGDRLPWYAIGASLIAANISTEHFIGMVGMAYVTGFMLAHWEWGNFLTYSILIWMFLPFYMRGGLYTMPEFLERRYNPACRYLFAICSLVLWIVAQMAVVMLAGAKAMQGMFGIDPFTSILVLAVLAGSYTIYGGLISVAWTDLLQFIVLMVGGAIVAAIGLHRVGGVFALMHEFPQKVKLFYPATDPNFPWLGVYTGAFSVGIWYTCTNQFMVQRCLGARSEWDSRMGVIAAGYVQAVLPFLVVVPGVIAFKLYPGLADPDQAYPTLVRELIPGGLGGIVMAGLASALMSHLSSVLNSCSTVFTMDLWRPLIDRKADDRALVRMGRVSAFWILLIATLLALWFTRGQHSVFLLVQDVGAWVAAPISVLFLLGILWRRATATAAVTVLLFGFPYTWFLQSVLFKQVSWLRPFDNWLNRTFFVWVTCMAVMIGVSLLTEAPDPAKIRDIIWTPQAARLLPEERARNRGLRNLFLWWALMVGIILSMYGYVIWFQFWGPGASVHYNSRDVSTTPLDSIQGYIRQTWHTLTRSNANLIQAIGDSKDVSTRSIVYVAGDEDIDRISTEIRNQIGLEDFNKIEIRRLPATPSQITEHGLLYLPNPYVVPGGRFNEMYGWDSYFIQVGLLRDGEVSLAKDLADNVIYEIEHYGKILNANRTYYLTRSQPPFLTEMLLGVYDRTSDLAWLKSSVPAIEKYYDFWMQSPHLIADSFLSRYYDTGEGPAPEVVAGEHDKAGRGHYELVRGYYGAHKIDDYDVSQYYDASSNRLTELFYKGDRSMRESGFDPSNRFGAFNIDVIHYAPVCLNSLLYRYETEAAQIMAVLGNNPGAEEWRARASLRQGIVNERLWDESDGMYYDYQFVDKRLRRYPFLTTFYPLWVGLATPEQAARVAGNLRLFERPGGLATSTHESGNQWDSPFGWAPLQLISVQGLRRYGYNREADRISIEFLSMVLEDFSKTHTIVEKYDVKRRASDVSGNIAFGYNTNEIGFGWTNAAFNELYYGLSDRAASSLS